MHGDHASRSEPEAVAGLEMAGKPICDQTSVDAANSLSPNYATIYANSNRLVGNQKFAGNMIEGYNFQEFAKPVRLSFDSDNGFASTGIQDISGSNPVTLVSKGGHTNYETSGLCNLPREMSGSFQPQSQRIPASNALSPLFNPDGNIFDESFDFDDFMFGQSGAYDAANHFELVNHASQLNFNCDSGRSSSQSSSEDNQPKMERDLLDGEPLFRTTSCPSTAAADEPSRVGNLTDQSNVKENPKSKEARERGQSLSNDSGVESCSYLDSAFITPPSVSIPTQLPSVSSFQPALAQMPQRRSSKHSAVKEESHHHETAHRVSRCPLQNVNTSPKSHSNLNNNNSNEIEPKHRPYPSIESEDSCSRAIPDARTVSRDTDNGDDDVYGGGETFASAQYANHPFSLDVKNASKKTAYNEKWGVKVLKAWCVEANTGGDFERLNADELNLLLARFWSEVRKSNGDYYGRNSLFNLRAMINKHLKGKPYCVTFDIVTDDRFRSSNERLEEQLKILKGIGRTITHKQPISINDLRKMYESGVLGTSNPLSLLRKVWFEVTLHFCHKGSESQEKLRKDSFDIFREQNGRRYIARTTPTDGDEIRMYETGGELCPVKSFEFYLQKLHALQPRLFQQPRRKSTPESPMWYGKAPIGEKALQQMMANISTASTLSKRYTNHCVRTTALEQFSHIRRKGNSALKEKSRSESFPDAFQHIISPQMMPQQVNMFSVNQVHGRDGRAVEDAGRIAKLSHGNPYHGFDQSLNSSCASAPQFSSDIMQMAKQTDPSGNFSFNGNSYRGGQKRSYVPEVPAYPPPAYNEHPDLMRTAMLSPPTKRIRSDEFTELDSFYTANYEHGYQNFEMQPLHEPDAQQKQRHRFYGVQPNPHCEKKQFDNVQKCFSDDSGTGGSLLSPISINTLSTENDTSLFNLQNPTFSDSCYGMMGSDLNQAKSVSPNEPIDLNLYKNYDYQTSSMHLIKRPVQSRDRTNQIDSYQNIHNMMINQSPVSLSM